MASRQPCVFTIGFSRKSAEQFFTLLRHAGVKTLVDVRLNNLSQLAGFSKRDDLKFFLKELAGIEYVHLADLAPTSDMLRDYRKAKGNWAEYEKRFLDLLTARRVEDTVPKSLMVDACLLCSESSAEHCHRRLVAEYLEEKWGSFSIRHL